MTDEALPADEERIERLVEQSGERYQTARERANPDLHRDDAPKR